MAIYGVTKYGASYYGVQDLPSSPDYSIFDFCYPTNSTMAQLFSYPQTSSDRSFGSPYIFFDGSDDLCLMSNDGVNSGFRIDNPVTNDFTFQFTFLASALPLDFSDTVNSRLFVGVFNQSGNMVGLLFSLDQGLALSRDGVTVDELILDSGELFDESGDYFTVRLAVDSSNNRTHIYITKSDLVSSIGHQLRFSIAPQVTPAGQTDHVRFEVVGGSQALVDICIDCLRLDGSVDVNQRPVADPGADKTVSAGQYATFDGSGSYDPESSTISNYWWTITDAPTDSDFVLTGVAATDNDASGFTNLLLGSPGDFSEINQGDLIFIGDYNSVVMYVSDDGSTLATINRTFPANVIDSEWTCIRQTAWDGDWAPSSMFIVQNAGTDPSVFTPATGDSYLVLAGAVGDWLNEDQTIATWNGSSWDFTDPVQDDILYNVAHNLNYRYLYQAPAPPPHNGIWYQSTPKPWELQHRTGRTWVESRAYAALTGLYVIDLIVSDGELSSEAVEVLLSAYTTDVALGLTPDLSFMWNYISDFWDLVEDKDCIESFWGGFAQILAGELLALWQHDYAKDIFNIQRTFQRQWLHYDPLYEEPNYDELPVEIENSVNVSGYSSTPNVQVPNPLDPATTVDSETAYDLGVIVSNITDSHYLVLSGICYKIMRIENDTTTVVITREAITTGTGRPKAWMIRPTISSQSSDFTKEGVSAGDSAVFEVINDSDIILVSCYIWGVRENIISFDDSNITSYISSGLTTRLKYVRRRTNILIDDLVTSIPRLQEVIALSRVEGAPDPIYESKDFKVQEITTALNQEVNWLTFYEAWFDRKDYGFDGEYTAVNQFYSASANFTSSLGEIGADISNHILVTEDGRFRLLSVVDANTVSLFDNSLEAALSNKDWEIREIIDPPDILWAEITFLDNRPTIENNFGRLIGFTLDDLEERTDDLDYLSAVQGLWYATWFGRTVEKMRIGAQILLGLPFAEAAGTIIDIKSPHDATRDRVIVKDDSDNATLRSYYFPTVVGIADNSETGVSLSVGDHIDQFDPISKGVRVDDWVSDPDWANTYIGSGDLSEPQKIHNFLVKVSSDVFDISNLTFLSSFLTRIKPSYTYPVFAVTRGPEENIDVATESVFGPVIPLSGYYPDTWPSFGIKVTWNDPPPNEENAAVSITRVTPATYDATERWPTKRFVTPRALEDSNPFGNVHLADNMGRTPDGWEGSWGGLPATHEITRDEGPRRYDATDESGHKIHKFDAHLSVEDILAARDGHMEENLDPPTYWSKVGAPSKLEKSTLQAYSGTRSLLIESTTEGDGGYNVFGASDSDDTPTIHGVPSGTNGGYQVAVVGWVYLVSGQAHFRLRDQDGSNYIAEVRKSSLYNQWVQFVLHSWVYSGSTSPLRFEALVGPAGGNFYLDSVEAFVKSVPWGQWGFDRSIMGRTGGYSFGGDPDEYFQTKLHFMVS